MRVGYSPCEKQWKEGKNCKWFEFRRASRFSSGVVWVKELLKECYVLSGLESVTVVTVICLV